MATSNQARGRHSAGLFDIRNIIGLLLFIYGIVVLIMGLVGTSDRDNARAGGLNVNLWAGLGMAVVGALFLVWAYTKPIVVPDEPEVADVEDGGPAG